MIYLPSIISVSYYFEKRRALATGIAVCGAGVGCFVFAPAGESPWPAGEARHIGRWRPPEGRGKGTEDGPIR